MDSREILLEIVSKYNLALNNRGLLKTLLADYYMGDKRIQNLLLMVYDEGIVNEVKGLLEIRQGDLSKYEKRLELNYGVDRKIAKDALAIWLFALNVKLDTWENNDPSCERFQEICTIDKDPTQSKTEVVIPDNNVISDDLYLHMKNHYKNNKTDLVVQLAFIEVLQSIIQDFWFNNGDCKTLESLIKEYYFVERSIKTDNVNINYMLKYVRSEVLICQGKIEDTIELYYELLNWDLLKNSVKYKNGMEDVYEAVVCNLYQFLLMKDKPSEAKHVYSEHYEAVQHAIKYFKDQIQSAEYDNDQALVKQWLPVYNTLTNGTVGELFFLEDLDYYAWEVVRSSGYRSMIYECLGDIYNTDVREFVGLSVFSDSISLEKKDDGYYLKKPNGRKLFDVTENAKIENSYSDLSLSIERNDFKTIIEHYNLNQMDDLEDAFRRAYGYGEGFEEILFVGMYTHIIKCLDRNNTIEKADILFALEYGRSLKASDTALGFTCRVYNADLQLLYGDSQGAIEEYLSIIKQLEESEDFNEFCAGYQYYINSILNVLAYYKAKQLNEKYRLFLDSHQQSVLEYADYMHEVLCTPIDDEEEEYRIKYETDLYMKEFKYFHFSGIKQYMYLLLQKKITNGCMDALAFDSLIEADNYS